MYGVESTARVFYLARCNGRGKPARTRLLAQWVWPRGESTFGALLPFHANVNVPGDGAGLRDAAALGDPELGNTYLKP